MTAHALITHDGRLLRIEHVFVGDAQAPGPLLVFLHEGLGSLTMWRGFPQQLCSVLGRRGLVYARPGYGHSTPRAPDEHWRADYLHRQALEVLPALLAQLGVDGPYALVGHSDGGSIALIHAAHDTGRRVAWVVAMAPHILVEPVSLAGIRATRAAFETDAGLRQRLARHHADVDSAFYGWCDAWLDPAFADWSIVAEIAAIRCPVLALQGVDDEYGTLAQVQGIARQVPQAHWRALTVCGHTPFRDQPQQVVEAITTWLQAHESR